MSAAFLIGLTVVSILVLLFLIIVLRMQAFIALLLVSLLAAVAGGIPAGEIIDTIQQGMGGILGYIAVVIGIGTMIGEMLHVSGGAKQIADTIIKGFGERKAPWALSLIGLIVAIPVFFEVALILFIPLVYNITKKTGKSILRYGIPLAAGIAVAHSFIPPTPGPVAVAALIGADLGWVIFFGLIAGIPATIVGGIFFGRYIGERINVGVPEKMVATVPGIELGGERRKPGFGIAVAIIIVPLILILSNTATNVWLGEDHTLSQWMSFVGHPFSALMISILMAFYFLGTKLGFTREEVQRVATKSMEPVGMIILLTGAGGVFGRVLVATGVGEVLVDVMSSTNLPVVLFAFLVATVIRVAQGSATVAMVTAAGLIAPIIEMGSYSPPLIGTIVIAIACGATVLSHVNDSGFWLVKEYMGLTEKQTLKSWTIMETIIGVTGVSIVLVISFFL
ncbi:MAG: gluconate transporter [Balneolaceae bacterium]|nr:MAG: gluconate transporter [Balneolaceae bacterium]